jgi:hypothetical protein
MSGQFTTPAIPTLTAIAPGDANEPVTYDFTKKLALITGDTLASVVSVTGTPTGLTIQGGNIVSGLGGAATAVVVLLSNGVLGATYLITLLVTTAHGRTMEQSFYIPCVLK